MTQNSKLSVAAKNFVERFGDDAPAEAKRRAEELRRSGNTDSATTWMQIYEEVKVLVERGSTTTH
jgi:hypothetical protein